MRLIRTFAALIALCVLATATVGQEQPVPAPASTPAPSPAPATTPADKPPADAPPASSATPPAAPKGVVRGDEFIPTQEIQADEEATFPVDI
jgi:hypothetical protein